MTSPTASRRFLIATTLVVVAIVGSAGLLNTSVDPYGMLGRNTLGIFVSNERITLPGLIARSPHDVLLLGNSRIAYVDPSRIGCQGVFNGAFGAARPEEMLSFLRQFGEGTKVAAIGLDLIMFDSVSRPWQAAPFDPETRLSPIEYVFSLDVVWESLSTLVDTLKDEPFAVSPLGQRNPEEEWVLHDALESNDYTRVLDLMTRRYRDYRRSERRLEALRTIREWLDARDVETVVFMNPLHPEIDAIVDGFERREEFSRIQEEIRGIFPDLVDLKRSRWSDPEHFFRHDPYHFKPETGEAILRTLLAERAPELCGT